MIIERERFIAEYRRAVPEVLAFVTPENQRLIAQHNAGWDPETYRFDSYLALSERRYLRVVDNFNRQGHQSNGRPSVLDVGGFLGAFPLALARIGADVTLVEEYGYYGTAFDELARHLSGNGVSVWPLDFTRRLADQPSRHFDLVTAMAILEHLPDSPRVFMNNLRSYLAPDGVAALEVPNIAYWPNRVRALKGESVHQPFALLYGSSPPFTGHHREYTASELRDLLHWTGFEVLSVERFNYTLDLGAIPRSERLRTLFFMWPALVLDSCREVVLAMARLAAAPAPADHGDEPRTVRAAGWAV
jgi:2-polyprenyl-3-methyl-5-hydroxy-6-metoxy-1,4-benzoquinol methylase